MIFLFAALSTITLVATFAIYLYIEDFKYKIKVIETKLFKLEMKLGDYDGK